MGESRQGGGLCGSGMDMTFALSQCSAGSTARVLSDGADVDLGALAFHELPFHDFPQTGFKDRRRPSR